MYHFSRGVTKQKKAAESKLVMHTRKQAEGILHIAIEQLDAVQQSAVTERTFDLDHQVCQLTGHT